MTHDVEAGTIEVAETCTIQSIHILFNDVKHVLDHQDHLDLYCNKLLFFDASFLQLLVFVIRFCESHDIVFKIYRLKQELQDRLNASGLPVEQYLPGEPNDV